MIALDFPNAVPSEDRFFGRGQERNQIQTSLLTNQRVPVVVIGERRVGKTSIHTVAIQHLKNQSPEPFVPLIIEPRGIQSVDQFIESVLIRLATCTKNDLRDCGLVCADNHVHIEAPEQLDAAFLRLSTGSAGQRFLLCVDEFDELIRIAGEAGNGERMKLMGIIHHLVEKTITPLSLFLTMTRLPEGASKEVASPLLAKCEVIELRPFSNQDTTDMVLGLVQDQAIFTPAELESLHVTSGGHPYITKLLLANLFNQVPKLQSPARISPEMLRQAVNAAVDDPRAHYAFENIYRVHLNADEKRVLLYLAERDEPVDIGELRVAGVSCLTAAKNLEKRHYLIERDGEYLLKARFLGYWLRNWVEFDEEIERLRVHRMVNPWLEDEGTASTNGLANKPANTTINNELYR